MDVEAGSRWGGEGPGSRFVAGKVLVDYSNLVAEIRDFVDQGVHNRDDALELGG